MSPESTSKPSKTCPTCGTRLAEDAVRCLVCGTDLGSASEGKKTSKSVQGSRMPTVTISVPLILFLFLIFLGVGAGLVYYALQQTGQVVEPTITPTVTLTATATITPTPVTPTATNTPAPTATPQSYTVQSGDSCSTIAFAFGVSIPSIVLLNDLPASCDTLVTGQKLLIPIPTATATPLPSATPNAAEATRSACGELAYAVKDTDTLSSISLNYNIPIASIKQYNGMVNDVVRAGQVINLPLCQRNATPGPTPTATPPAPYGPPNLLLPADGSVFSIASESVALQWAAIGTLRENEAYAISVLDVTSGQDVKIVDYVIDTKFIVPSSFLGSDPSPRLIRWWVFVVRQEGSDTDGNPIWTPAGAVSANRDFIWVGAPFLGVTPTP